jgi:UDP:flavonoid glycosyltransferase YjiC (YdhE family)
MPSRKCKILFFAEGATLAHVGRPLVLAQGLDLKQYDVTFARPASYAWVSANVGFRVVDLNCQNSAAFASRLERGLPLYDLPTLERYVDNDLALIDVHQPDVIAGDFRLSLTVSARLRGVPYITICDAYWSPEQPLRPALPVLSFTRFAPIPLAKQVFRAVWPLAQRLHAAPVENLRARHGLPSLGHDLRRCYTDADLRLFANIPALFPQLQRSAQADFIGPIAWSPPDRTDLDVLKGSDPLIYVTMGSSGDPRVLAALIPVLEQTGARIVVATAGKPLPAGIGSARTQVFDFLPGDQLCRHASLVVCNGGSPTTNQALSNGVPVLGIASNMDQFLNMQAIEGFSAGIMLRADRASATLIHQAVASILGNATYRQRAGLLAQDIDKSTTLPQAIESLN